MTTNEQVQAAARAERDKILPDLWNAIVKHTEGDAAFWLGEILLNEITKETGYTGQGSFASRATPADPALDPATVEKKKIPPVDRSARVLTDGSPITPDHRDITASGQQKAYVVLTPEERAKGFSRPYRDAYRHLKCGAITTMGRAIAETYARDPSFYSGTFCSTCRTHFPVGEDGEFTWYEMDGSEGPKVGT